MGVRESERPGNPETLAANRAAAIMAPRGLSPPMIPALSPAMSEFVYSPPPDGGLSPLLVTDRLVIVEKPSGLLTVPGRGEDREDCLLNRVRVMFPEALTVHRLDMDTSGLVLYARGAKAQSQLSKLFQERKVKKRYEALVEGLLAREAGEIKEPLIVDWPNRPRQKIDHQEGRPAHTRYLVMARDPGQGLTRVELEPVTGRSHQLRVHMTFLGHPILGDTLYGSPASREKLPRLALHAKLLAFTEPETGRAIRVESLVPF